MGEQKRGIWKFGAEPDDPTTGTLIARIGQYGMVADVEGLTIYCAAGGEGYLIASSQGNSTFKVFNRKPPHEYITTFTVEGAEETDGFDVTSVNLGPDFPEGLFALHKQGRPLAAQGRQELENRRMGARARTSLPLAAHAGGQNDAQKECQASSGHGRGQLGFTACHGDLLSDSGCLTDEGIILNL